LGIAPVSYISACRCHVYPPEFQFWHALSSAGAVVLAVGYLMPLA
jgi:cytochrome c oxidase subunit 1